MQLVEKVTQLLEKKYLTNDFYKGTDELVDIKKSVVTIRIKGIDEFECQSKRSTGWFKLDNGFLKTKFTSINSEFYKELF